jgi:hypothetical protein
MRTRAGRNQKYHIVPVLINYAVMEMREIENILHLWTTRCTEHNPLNSVELWLTFVNGQYAYLFYVSECRFLIR